MFLQIIDLLMGPKLRQSPPAEHLRAQLVVLAVVITLAVVVPTYIMFISMDLPAKANMVLLGLLPVAAAVPLLYLSGSVKLTAHYLIISVFVQIANDLTIENSFSVGVLVILPLMGAALASVAAGIFWTAVVIAWLTWFGLSLGRDADPIMIGIVVTSGIMALAIGLSMSILETLRGRAMRESAELHNVQRAERSRYKDFVGATYPLLIELERGAVVGSATGAVEVLGLRDHELEGFALGYLLHPEDRQRALQPPSVNDAARQEVRMRHQDGRWLWVEWAKVPFTEDSTRWLVGVRDIESERLDRQRADQRARLDSLGYLAAGVTHDFNNLLTVILAFAETIPESAAREEIVESATAAAELIRQLSVLGGRDTAVDEPPPVVSLDTALRGLESMSRSLLGSDVVFQSQELDRPLAVRLAPVELNQIVLNVVKNAANAMPGGGLFRLEVAEFTVDERLAKQLRVELGEYVKITFQDTGEGMDAHTLEHALDPFFTAGSQHKGMGLGLANCDSIARRRGGAVLLESEVGIGTTVTLLLPKAQAEMAAVVASVELSEADAMVETAPQFDRATVFVLEGNVQIRGAICDGLDNAGFHAYALSSLHDVNEYASIIQPDVLIADTALGDVSGPEVARSLRARYPDLGILFISGRERGDAQLMAEFDAHFLAKPFRVLDLIREIHTLGSPKPKSRLGETAQ